LAVFYSIIMVKYSQMREQKQPKARLVRNRDGSLRPVANDDKTDQLKQIWGKQSATLEITAPSLKQDLQLAFGSIKKRANKRKQSAATVTVRPQKQASQNNVKSITINIPAFKVPTNFNKKLLANKYFIAGASLVVLSGIIWLVWPGGNQEQAQTEPAQVAGQVQYRVKPSFSVMSPSGDGVDNLGGYALISPAGEPNVYAYIDEIDNVPIKVSQQELPSEIYNNDARVRELASGFNATEQIRVDDRSAYVGKSIDGPQAVIFVRENILVLIASDSEIPNKSWVDYLGNLRF
jgi:hypothetical protein